MFIHQAALATGLTKKAVEYYTQQGLVAPGVGENGYRDYSGEDVALLGRISVLRKLDVTTDEIREILADGSGEALQAISVVKELRLQREGEKQRLLNELCAGKAYKEIADELRVVDNRKTITEKLLEAFPGYYGRFICLHFSRFLDDPIRSQSQQTAFESILAFLDSVPPLVMPEALQQYLREGTGELGSAQIAGMLENVKLAVEQPDDFLSRNRETLEWYLAYKQSDEYKSSPACQLLALMRDFYTASGYYDIFIPAMKQLSEVYAQYSHQLELANKKFLERFPEAANLP